MVRLILGTPRRAIGCNLDNLKEPLFRRSRNSTMHGLPMFLMGISSLRHHAAFPFQTGKFLKRPHLAQSRRILRPAWIGISRVTVQPQRSHSASSGDCGRQTAEASPTGFWGRSESIDGRTWAGRLSTAGELSIGDESSNCSWGQSTITGEAAGPGGPRTELTPLLLLFCVIMYVLSLFLI